MKKLLLTLFIFSSLFSHAQNPLVKMWDKRYGGTDNDNFTCFQKTKDGGFILGGCSSSYIGGNKTQDTHGFYDYWVVKLDSMGNKQWDKDFGGIENDYLLALQQTTDGGYVLGGLSFSGISYDKTEATRDTSITMTDAGDYWIVKIDSAGNKQWDKDFGGYDSDQLYAIQQTTDKGYILGGYTRSGIGGDKTQTYKDTSSVINGRADFWIIKTDSLGNKQWDKDYGGYNPDYLYSLMQVPDGGYVLGGTTFSEIGGDKTESLYGYSDYWIIKIDSAGTVQWDKDFGCTLASYLYTLYLDVDGGYILGGDAGSGIGGNKTTPSRGNYDYWLVKVDTLGNKIWEADYGGTGPEEVHSISRTNDGGYIISGDSYSTTIGGDKTQINFNSEATWLVKIDSLRNIEWDKTCQTPSLADDETGLTVQTSDGCYVTAHMTFGWIGGDNSQPNWDPTNNSSDYWIVKFCDSAYLPPTVTQIFADPLLCPGTCDNFTTQSFNATSYQWSFPFATPDTSTDVNPTNICYANPGTYDVQLIATNANGSDTLTLANYITVYPTPSPQSITQNGDTLFAIAGAATYQWYFNTNIINGATNYFYVADTSGDYNVVCTDANGCEVEAAVFNVVAGVESTVFSLQSAVVFPNPVTSTFEIRNSIFEIQKISIYNMIGEMVLAADCRLPTVRPDESVLWQIDCGLLPSGMYYLEVSDDEKTFRSKFIKQ